MIASPEERDSQAVDDRPNSGQAERGDDQMGESGDESESSESTSARSRPKRARVTEPTKDGRRRPRAASTPNEKGKRAKSNGGASRKASGSTKVNSKQRRPPSRAAASRTGKSRGAARDVPMDADGLALGDEEDEGETRCICGLNDPDDAVGFFVQCEMCSTWQHGLCVGIEDEADAPDLYFCERCRPDLHAHRIAKRGPSSVKRRPNGAKVEEDGSDDEEDEKPMSKSSAKSKGKRRASDEKVVVKTERDDEESGDMPPPAAGGRRRSKSKGARESQSPTLPHQLAILQNPAVAYPSTSHFAQPKGGRRRSTMNSRDAAFEEELAAVMALSTQEAVKTGALPADLLETATNGSAIASDEEEDQESPPPPPRKRPAPSNKRRRTDEDEDRLRVRASRSPSNDGERSDATAVSAPAPKRQRGGRFGRKGRGNADADDDDLPAPSRRPANARKRVADHSASPAPPSPAMSHASSFQPSGSRARASPNKRAAAAAAAAALAEDRPSGSRRGRDALTNAWGLPDHLLHLSHLLPTTPPSPVTIGQVNDSGSPDESSSSSASAALAQQQHLNGGEVIVENATRVRFPHKRVTMPDMRKRANNVLTYLSRVSVDLNESSQRARKLGLAVTTDGVDLPPSATTASSSAAPSPTIGAGEDMTTAAMLEKLQREVSRFQDRFFAPAPARFSASRALSPTVSQA